ncbi:H/ACA ribonucleoprotein complex subunit 2-like protein [Oopsacas minuta]|uniref:H/ACA ribonucleoprotein complex subunit 2 n=1 Tax=Oopsacas minuta TaxID=111878 RepID=A0AAV7JC14_9METZ|nr:H/ACA ribonucleoprotein complex subunit 2-like protein [Oopsacas minuta]
MATEDLESLSISETDKKEIYRQKLNAASIIAYPIASRKMNKRVLKLVRHAASKKGTIRGVKNTIKAVRKGEKGLIVIGGNITPIDTISHVPVYLEEQDIPYIYVPAKEDIGSAFGSQRATCMVMVQRSSEIEEEYDRVVEDVNKMPKIL